VSFDVFWQFAGSELAETCWLWLKLLRSGAAAWIFEHFDHIVIIQTHIIWFTIFLQFYTVIFFALLNYSLAYRKIYKKSRY